MRKGKNGIRRIAALACSVALLATMLPTQVLAADEATSEPLAAVTSLEESGEEKAPEQGETGIQPETENACTKSEDCAAETHEEGCPKYVAPAEEEDTDPVVSCTKTEDCQAKTHEEGCPKYEEPETESLTNALVAKNKSDDIMETDRLNKTDDIQPSTDWYTGHESDSTYNLFSAEDLAGLAQLVNNGNSFEGKTLNLRQAIDLENKMWMPIGNTEDNTFEGVFNGNGYTISNITISLEGMSVGFFGYLNRATVQDLTLNKVRFASASANEEQNIGGLCGSLMFIPSKIQNCHVVDMVVDQVQAKNIGGLVGYLYSGQDEAGNKISIEGSSVKDLSLNGSCDFLGGLIGNNSSYSYYISDCSVASVSLFNDSIQSSSACGGIAGKTTDPTYSSCSVSDSSVSAHNVGGALGISAYGGTLEGIQISNVTVTAIAEEGSVAGVIGAVNANSVSIKNCSLKDVTIQGKAQNQLNVLLGSGSLDDTEYTQSNISFFLNGEEVLPYTSAGVKYFLIKDDLTAIVTGASEDLTDGQLIIPDFIEYESKKYAVSTIAASAFSGNTAIKTLSLGNQLTDISASAFKDCVNITGMLVIPDSVEKIEQSAFYGCKNLTGIEIGDSVTTIEKHAFNSCEKVTSLNLGKNIETIAPAAFANLTALSGTIIIPESVKSLEGNGNYSGTGAFSNCKNIECVILTCDNISVGAYVFENFESLKAVVAPSSATFTSKTFQNSAQNVQFYLIGNTIPENIPLNQITAFTNGGTFSADTQFTAGTLATPTKSGAIFEGWYDSADFTGAAVTTAEAGKTYYAKWIDLGVADVSLEYRQTQTFTAPAGVTFSNWKSEDPSVATVDNGTITAVGVGETTISVEAAANGQTTVAKISVTVTPMNITFGTGTGENPGGTITYQYNGGQAPAFSQFATFYPAKISDGSVSPVEGSSAVTLVEGKDIVFNYDAGAGSNDYEYLPLNVTSEANPETGLPVTVKLLNENYRFVTASNVTPGTGLRLSVVVTDKNLTESAITGLGDATLSFTYDGTGKAAVTGLTDISADNISQFTLHFHGWGGTAFAEQHLTGDASVFTEEAVAKIAPTEPGSYLMILTGVSENHYAYQSWIMTINKATVTITAADKTVIAGDKDGLPFLSNPTEGKDYTVTGLAAGHSLTTAPTLNYSEDANVDAVATYSIIPSGAAADEKYYTLQYVDGTLHVEKIAIIEGANQTWTKESGKDLVIRSNADFSDFLGVTVNDVELVQNQDYTAKSGSTIVTIKADYLNSLAAGDYKIAIVSNTGSAVTKFTVKAEAAGNSDTSNNDNTAGGNTGSTTTQSGSGIVYYTCPACGYHDWTAGADGYKCNHCGYVESVKQLSGYGNVKGVYEPKTSAAAAQSASATSSSAIPQTSDAMPVGLLGGVTVVAAAAFAALFVLRKRKHND